jgi:CRP-like cAMP-binding protein
MEYSSILSNVAKHISMDETEVAYFISLLKTKTLKKKDFLLKAGDPCTTINYVHSGALRSFYQDSNDNEVTIMFAIADWWITDMPCFINQLAAMTSIESMGDSTVFRLAKEDLDTLYSKVPKFERFFRILMQNAYVREQLRSLQNLSLPAEERYAKFLEKYPAIAKQLTQKQIASYLGITPEFLSAVRKKMSKGTIS